MLCFFSVPLLFNILHNKFIAAVHPDEHEDVETLWIGGVLEASADATLTRGRLVVVQRRPAWSLMWVELEELRRPC